MFADAPASPDRPSEENRSDDKGIAVYYAVPKAKLTLPVAGESPATISNRRFHRTMRPIQRGFSMARPAAAISMCAGIAAIVVAGCTVSTPEAPSTNFVINIPVARGGA